MNATKDELINKFYNPNTGNLDGYELAHIKYGVFNDHYLKLEDFPENKSPEIKVVCNLIILDNRDARIYFEYYFRSTSVLTGFTKSKWFYANEKLKELQLTYFDSDNKGFHFVPYFESLGFKVKEVKNSREYTSDGIIPDEYSELLKLLDFTNDNSGPVQVCFCDDDKIFTCNEFEIKSGSEYSALIAAAIKCGINYDDIKHISSESDLIEYIEPHLISHLVDSLIKRKQIPEYLDNYYLNKFSGTLFVRFNG